MSFQKLALTLATIGAALHGVSADQLPRRSLDTVRGSSAMDMAQAYKAAYPAHKINARGFKNLQGLFNGQGAKAFNVNENVNTNM